MGESEKADSYIVTPGQAAKRLGVSASGIRRLLVIYEDVHGELGRNPDTNARVISSEVVEQLAAARLLVEAERFTSIKEALTALEQGLQPDITIADTLNTASRDLSGQALGLILDELRAVRSELAELRPVRDEVQALREEVVTLKALPAADTTPGDDTVDARHSLLVRLALWLERRLGR
jgi:phage gp37-like protein